MYAFDESHTQLTNTLEVATLLQTRTPTGKRYGPLAGVLLSRPIMFHVMGVTVSVVAAATGNCGWTSDAIKKIAVKKDTAILVQQNESSRFDEFRFIRKLRRKE